MSRARLVPLLALLIATSCLFRSSPEGAAGELNEFANAGAEATYAATYRFLITGPLAEGRTTRMEIVQDPPVSIRKLEVFTNNAEGEPVPTRSWQARNERGNFVCTDYAEVGVRCQSNPLASGTFGSVQLDEFFDTPRRTDAYESVAKASRTLRIAGQVGTCFEAVPASASPPPVTSPQPAFTPERFRFELCYSDDGIFLRGSKTIQGEVPPNVEERRETVVEAVSVSHVVPRQELKLPGPVVGPDDVRP